NLRICSGHFNERSVSRRSRRVFFFLSAGWGPVVRALPIMNRLVDYGVASSFAVGGLTDSKIREMGFDPIEISVPPLDTPVDRTSNGWSPYHFLALRTVKTLLDHVEAYRKAISDGNPALVVTDISPVAALAAKSLRVPHATISQSLFLP